MIIYIYICLYHYVATCCREDVESNDLCKIFSGNFNGRFENARWNVRIRLAVLLLLLLLLNDTNDGIL